MERVELALKNLNGDDFSVDDLLDFSNDDVFVEDETELKTQRKKGVNVSLNDENTLGRSKDLSTACENLGSFPASELSIPMDDLAELEWLSNFVDDSFTPYSAPTKKPDWVNRRHRVAPVKEKPCFKTPLPVKNRSKRTRTGASVWSLASPSLTDSSSSSTNSSEVFSSSGQTQTQTRRCSHCGVQKTPQWRAGPMGAKTLCNACGVRFKSGRLLPEYRPACSPTFSSELHSNHHRKVVEMRRKKEMSDADETGLNQPVQTGQVVPSF